jgi:hypothetical protein
MTFGNSKRCGFCASQVERQQGCQRAFRRRRSGRSSHCNRSVCWAHLERDFRRISQREGIAGQVGKELVCLCEQMFALWHQWKNNPQAPLLQDLQISLTTCREKVKFWLERGSICGHDPTHKIPAKTFWLLKSPFGLLQGNHMLTPRIILPKGVLEHSLFFENFRSANTPNVAQSSLSECLA